MRLWHATQTGYAAVAIAGQGTLGLEMLAAAPGIDAIVVPVGGGGMIAGIAVAARTLRPEIEKTVVEGAGAAGLAALARSGFQAEVVHA